MTSADPIDRAINIVSCTSHKDGDSDGGDVMTIETEALAEWRRRLQSYASSRTGAAAAVVGTGVAAAAGAGVAAPSLSLITAQRRPRMWVGDEYSTSAPAAKRPFRENNEGDSPCGAREDQSLSSSSSSDDEDEDGEILPMPLPAVRHRSPARRHLSQSCVVVAKAPLAGKKGICHKRLRRPSSSSPADKKKRRRQFILRRVVSPCSSPLSVPLAYDDVGGEGDADAGARRKIRFASPIVTATWTRPRTCPRDVRALFYRKADEKRFRRELKRERRLRRLGIWEDEDEDDVANGKDVVASDVALSSAVDGLVGSKQIGALDETEENLNIVSNNL